MHPVQCAQSAWIRGGIMIWICLLAAGSPQYLIHHRLVGWHGLDWTVLPTYSTFIVLCDACLFWFFPVWWWVLSMVLKGLWCNINIAANYASNLWINGETNTFFSALHDTMNMIFRFCFPSSAVPLIWTPGSRVLCGSLLRCYVNHFGIGHRWTSDSSPTHKHQWGELRMTCHWKLTFSLMSESQANRSDGLVSQAAACRSALGILSVHHECMEGLKYTTKRPAIITLAPVNKQTNLSIY